MMSEVTHRDYLAGIVFQAKDDMLLDFHGDGLPARVHAFNAAVGDYVEACAEPGCSSEKTFTGRAVYHLDPGTQARVGLAAQMRGVSIDQWAEEALSRQAAAELTAR